MQSTNIMPGQSRQPIAGEEEANFRAYKTDVSPTEFAAYTQGRSEDLNFPDLRLIRYEPTAKVIGVVESGHPAHEAVHQSITEQITLQMMDVPAVARLVPLGSPTMIKSADGAMGRPDACWKPLDAVGPASGPLSLTRQLDTCSLSHLTPPLEKNMPYPTLIVESAYQESWPDLARDMQDWLGDHTGVQLVIIIKIYKPYAEAEGVLTSPKLPSVRMEAQVFKRSPSGPQQTTQLIQFGSGGRVWNSHPPGVTASGMAVLEIPYSVLWASSSSVILGGSVPEWLNRTLKIDLFDVQQAVLRVC